MRRHAPPLLVALALVASAGAGAVSAQRRERAEGSERSERPAQRRDGRGAGGHGSITADIPCSACHTPEGWTVQGGSSESAGGFDHARTGFPLSGRHLGAGCTDCHRPDREIGRDCVGCHRDQHEGRLGQDCARCHTSIAWTDTRGMEIHRLTRLPLTGMHAIAACTDCHRRTEGRQYGAVPAECFACHENDYRRPDVHPDHQGSDASPPFSRDCARCHRTSGWSPAIVDPSTLGRSSGGLTAARPGRRHELRFPITRGPHRGASCASCHEDLRAPTAVRCTGCHAHNPVRVRRQHRTVSPGTDGRGCLGCHPGGVVR
jgi:hypothetical protein